MTVTSNEVPGFPPGNTAPKLTRGAIRALGDSTAGIPAEVFKETSQQGESSPPNERDVDPWVDNMGRSRY